MIFKFLEWLGVSTSGYNRLLLNFAGLKGPSGIWIGAGLLALFAASGYFMVRPLALRRRKIIILALHSAALAVALMIFLQPELRLAATQKLKSPVAVLIDDSETMSVFSGGEKSRIQTAQDWVKKNRAFFSELSADYELRWFAFDEKLKPLPANFPDQPDLKAGGPDTRILESISGIRKEIGNKPLSGVIVLSDGADRAELSRLYDKAAAPPRPGQNAAPGKLSSSHGQVLAPLLSAERSRLLSELKKRLSGSGRIYTVLAGSEERLKDLAITRLEHDSYGFVKNPFVVTAVVRALGDIPRQTSIQLWQEEQLLVTKPITIEPGKDQRVELEFAPQEVGRFLFRVALPAYPGEASAENNQKFFPLTIIRDRIRGLYIVGNPSWDEKFLRQTLRKNPAVDLVSFYILREIYDNPAAAEDELALIPFPTHKLFTEELSSFDLVIFQNFFGQPYMLPSYMSFLRDYVVEKGGGLICLGGPRSFLKDPFNLPLEEILPVDFSFSAANYKSAKFKMRLTNVGNRHPITKLLNDDIENKRLWDSLPEFDGFNQVLRPKPDSLVLADTRAGETPAMIAVREAGKGRVMMVATDSLWRWHFQVQGLGRESRYYQLFWERALRWLMKDPEMKPVSLGSVKEYYNPGEEITLYFQVQDSSYEPVSGATATLNIVSGPAGCQLNELSGQEVSPGKYRFQFKLDCAGGYRFQADASKAGKALGSDQEILVIRKESAEMDDLGLHPELLQALSEASRGKSLKSSQSAERIKFEKLELEEITAAKDIPIWNNWISWTLLTAFFGLTWALRRYYGLS